MWVFGYGSLMWRPGFDYVEARPARMAGVHRQPCVYSYVHRGTPERPGIVLGLDRGGSCLGLAFRIEPHNWDKTLDYLRGRELVTNVYLEAQRPARLDDSRTVTCTTFLVDTGHEQYAGRLSHAALLKQVRGAVGLSGPNEAYLLETANKLKDLGVRDRRLEALARDLSQDESSSVSISCS
ncbi:MAG: gamma-glutamylcyclotransferase [Pseudomonadota bacterium]